MNVPMQDNTNDGVGELQDVRSEIGEVKECRVCKYVLLFSFLVLLSVMTLVYFQGKQAGISGGPDNKIEGLDPIPFTVEQLDETTPVFEARILELGGTFTGSIEENRTPSEDVVVKVVGQVPFDKSQLREVSGNSSPE